ncbi:MAG TPA: SDR family oxidoreductase [Terracidiphilus sp.]|jgi:NAD(P)-dependent dehydrogenase (short-subunit alcohol dehydrogenase family)|nr:SDR family oxidoreductase [Terracidiphilus sp.]
MITIKAKTALVTGSSRGIGRGIALKLADSGVRQIGIHYLKNRSAAEQTAAAVSERGAEVKLVQADVTRPDEITRMFKDVREEFGSLDILVSNARPDVEHFYQPAFDIPLENWQKALDSQALAMLVSVREAVPIMSDGGRILAVTYATGGRTGSWQPWVAMGAAKAAMESLCRYFAVALAPRGITVNMISPGATEDSVFSTLPPTVLQMIRGWAEAGWVPMRRLTTPADVGAVAALLCTEEAGFVTGQLIYVDGGASLMSADFPLDLQKG